MILIYFQSYFACFILFYCFCRTRFFISRLCAVFFLSYCDVYLIQIENWLWENVDSINDFSIVNVANLKTWIFQKLWYSHICKHKYYVVLCHLHRWREFVHVFIFFFFHIFVKWFYHVLIPTHRIIIFFTFVLHWSLLYLHFNFWNFWTCANCQFMVQSHRMFLRNQRKCNRPSICISWDTKIKI